MFPFILTVFFNLVLLSNFSLKIESLSTLCFRLKPYFAFHAVIYVFLFFIYLSILVSLFFFILSFFLFFLVAVVSRGNDYYQGVHWAYV